MLREIKFLCLERSAEDFADMMMDAGAMSVSIEDADLGSPDERPLYGEPGTEPDTFAWNRSIVSVLADETFDATQAAAIAAKALGIETPVVKSDTTVPDEDWVRITQAQFSPVKVSDRLWIVPSWIRALLSVRVLIRQHICACSGLIRMSRTRIPFLTMVAVRAFWRLPLQNSALRTSLVPTSILKPLKARPLTPNTTK